MPANNKLTQMRISAIRQEEEGLRGLLEGKSVIRRFFIRRKMKRRIEKQLKSRLGPEYYVLSSLENGDLSDTVIH